MGILAWLGLLFVVVPFAFGLLYALGTFVFGIGSLMATPAGEGIEWEANDGHRYRYHHGVTTVVR